MSTVNSSRYKRFYSVGSISSSISESVPAGDLLYKFTSYSSLPISPPNEYICELTSPTNLSYCFVRYSQADVKWYIIECSLTNFAYRPKGTVYNSGGITVEVADGAVMIWEGKELSFRYRSDLSRPDWVAEVGYNITSIGFESYVIGTESDATLSANGWTVTESGDGTVSSILTYLNLTTQKTAIPNSIASISNTAILAYRNYCYFHGYCQLTAKNGTVTISISLDDNTDYIALERDAGYFVLNGTISAELNKETIESLSWVHFIVDQYSASVYVNGILVSVSKRTSSPASSSPEFKIGIEQSTDTGSTNFKFKDVTVIVGN